MASRLVTRYWIFGLAGVLACVSLVLTFQHLGTLNNQLGLAVAAELLLLFAGAMVLRRSLRVAQAIETQLKGVPRAVGQFSLQPLAESDPAALGWNAVVQRLQDQQVMSSLESRLAEKFASTDLRRWTQIFHALQDGICVCDRTGAIEMTNNSFVALLGLDRQKSLVGQNIFELLRNQLKGAAIALGQPVENSHAPFVAEIFREAEMRDGVLRAARTPLLDEQSQANGALWTLRDITQPKLAEEARNQFVYTATHELRTPLANIKAYAETLSLTDEIDVRDQKSFYNVINNEATRLSRFIDELLNVNQMESGAITLVRSETDVERLLLEVIENMKPQLTQKELSFQYQLAPKFPKLYADKDKLQAALVNLLGNAVKYTPAQGSVRFVADVDETQLSLHIEDTGIGISAEELPRLSEKFFRSSDARVQNIVGSGLGLAFAQEVARLHGGRIVIKSELNKGSRFTLVLPLKQGS